MNQELNTNNSDLSPFFQIKTQADLKKASAILHDARFTADAIGFDVSAKTFTLKCWVFEYVQKSDGTSRHWKAYRLSFTGVAECKVTTLEKVSYYEIATIRFAEGDHMLDLVTHYGIQIRLQIGKLDGVLMETDETREQGVNWGQIRIFN